MKPEYSNLPAYTVLESFCNMIGVQVFYGKTPPNSYAVAEVDAYPPHIVMRENLSDSYAQRVLAHEIGHFLVERLYITGNTDADYLIELQCDQIGNALYLLANRIADESDTQGERIDRFMNQAIDEVIAHNESTIAPYKSMKKAPVKPDA